jgi:hypothetical protein
MPDQPWYGFGPVEPAQLVSALEGVATRLGVPVRYEPMGAALSQGRPSGGLVKLRGKLLILVDEALGSSDRAAILAKALGAFDLDRIYLPPFVRAAIRAAGKHQVLEPRPLARARPTPPEDD